MSTQSQSNHPAGTFASVLRWVVAAPLVLATLGLGLWFFGGVVAPGYITSIVLGVAWFVVAGVLIGQLAKRRPAWKVPMRATFLAASVASAIGFYWTSIRDDKVNEAVVTGIAASRTPPPAPVSSGQAPAPAPSQNVEVSRGPLQTRAHSSRGTVAIVDLASGGRRLTFTDFETDNGPDLRVYLVNGPVRGDDDVDDVVDLGRLKGNVGNQQYAIPQGTDVAAYSTVVIWCRAFSVRFAQADLRAS